ncbi:hypothetical protein Gotri_015415, partial [Gossypium trilobum]|nr:hypothetical protein [Gossypium trilobum]
MAILFDQGYVNFGQWSTCHVSTEDNQDADNLVKLVQDRRHGLRVFEVSPLEGKEDMDPSTLKRIILLFKGFGKGY